MSQRHTRIILAGRRSPHDEQPKLEKNSTKQESSTSLLTPSQTSMKLQVAEQYSESEDEVEIEDEFGERIQELLDGLDTAYDPSTEPLPNVPAYHESFSMLEKHCLDLTRGATSVLRSSEYQDTETTRLLEQISLHESINYGLPRKIGLIGDSGVGDVAKN